MAAGNKRVCTVLRFSEDTSPALALYYRSSRWTPWQRRAPDLGTPGTCRAKNTGLFRDDSKHRIKHVIVIVLVHVQKVLYRSPCTRYCRKAVQLPCWLRVVPEKCLERVPALRIAVKVCHAVVHARLYRLALVFEQPHHQTPREGRECAEITRVGRQWTRRRAGRRWRT